MVGATCHNAVLYITNVMWTALGQDTVICVARHKVLYNVNCDYTKIVDISVVLNTLLIRLPSKCTVNLQMSVPVNLHSHSGNYAPSL